MFLLTDPLRLKSLPFLLTEPRRFASLELLLTELRRLVSFVLLSGASSSFSLSWFELFIDRRIEALIAVPLLLTLLCLRGASSPFTLSWFELVIVSCSAALMRSFSASSSRLPWFELVIDRRIEALMAVPLLLTPLLLTGASSSELIPNICDIVSDWRMEDLNPDLL